MSQTKNSGFTLFPAPPTPPHDFHAARQQTLKSRWTGQGITRPRFSFEDSRPPSLTSTTLPPLPTIDPSELTPAPLRIRKNTSYHRPRRSSLSLPIRAPSPSPERRTSWGNGDLVTPIPRDLSTTTISHHQASRRYDGRGHRKGPSGRLSQWLDIEQGCIDRGRLSMFLGNVLDASFTVPNLNGRPEPVSENGEWETMYPSSHDSLAGSRPCTAAKCECPPGTVICQWRSSPDYRNFTNWRSGHRSDLSVSSTTCMLQVPRGRFRTFSLDDDIPEHSEKLVQSPPGLSYDSKSSSNSDWSSPISPIKDSDVFNTTPDLWLSIDSSVTRLPFSVIPEVQEVPVRKSRVVSFSRPFRPESAIRQLANRFSQTVHEVVTPSKDELSDSRLEHRKNYLGSISTLSTFEFDFDFERSKATSSKRQTRYELFGLLDPVPERSQAQSTRPSSPPRRSRSSNSFRVYQLHDRQFSTSTTSSVNSICEFFAPITTATVVKASPDKPTLVINKRGNTPPTSLPNYQYWSRIQECQQRHSQGMGAQNSHFVQRQQPQLQLPTRPTVQQTVLPNARNITCPPAMHVQQQGHNLQVPQPDRCASTSPMSGMSGRRVLTDSQVAKQHRRQSSWSYRNNNDNGTGTGTLQPIIPPRRQWGWQSQQPLVQQPGRCQDENKRIFAGHETDDREGDPTPPQFADLEYLYFFT